MFLLHGVQLVLFLRYDNASELNMTLFPHYLVLIVARLPLVFVQILYWFKPLGNLCRLYNSDRPPGSSLKIPETCWHFYEFRGFFQLTFFIMSLDHFEVKNLWLR